MRARSREAVKSKKTAARNGAAVVITAAGGAAFAGGGAETELMVMAAASAAAVIPMSFIEPPLVIAGRYARQRVMEASSGRDSGWPLKPSK